MPGPDVAPDGRVEGRLDLAEVAELRRVGRRVDDARRAAQAEEDRVGPALQVDGNLYGPDIRKAVEAQRQALSAAAQSNPATLDIDAEGPAAAEITGRFKSL